MNDFQLDMTLNQNSNQFKNALDNGKFVFLAESTPPDNEQNINNAAERMMPLPIKISVISGSFPQHLIKMVKQ